LKPDHVVIDLVKDEKVKSNERIKHLAIQCAWHQMMEILSDTIKVHSGTGKVIVFADKKSDVTEITTNSSISSSKEIVVISLLIVISFPRTSW
jgi:ATP-dependent RNA helicase DDX21